MSVGTLTAENLGSASIDHSRLQDLSGLSVRNELDEFAYSAQDLADNNAERARDIAATELASHLDVADAQLRRDHDAERIVRGLPSLSNKFFIAGQAKANDVADKDWAALTGPGTEADRRADPYYQEASVPWALRDVYNGSVPTPFKVLSQNLMERRFQSWLVQSENIPLQGTFFVDDFLPTKLLGTGVKAAAGAAGALFGSMKVIGREESQSVLRNGTSTAFEAELLRIAQEGHALARHGGAVTDQQLFTRAITGIAPDGTSQLKNGQVVIPPSATAFNSNALLAESDLAIRNSHLNQAIAASPAGAQRVVVKDADMGMVVGRGFDRVSLVPNVAGPLQFHNSLSRVTGVYDFDAAKRIWITTTIYPGK